MPDVELNTLAHMAGGTDVPVADGGTGVSTLPSGQLVTGAGTSPVTGTAVPAGGLAGQTALDLKAPLASPTFTGTVTLPAATVTSAMLRNSTALSLIGRSANSSGVPDDIAATAATGAVLRESASSIAFGTVATAGITDAAITLAKLANLAEALVIGRAAAAGTGVPVGLTAAQLKTILGISAAAETVLDDTTVAAMLATLGGLPLAGGTITGAMVLGTGGSIAGGDKVAAALEIKDVGETAPSAGSITGSITRSFANGAVQTLTLTGNVTSLAISNPPASGIAGTITFRIDHGTGPFTWSHPSGIKWPGGTPPTMSSGASEISIVSYMTVDGGTTWDGAFWGADMS